jgi:DNA invertase Pin-like site-specific DNA recombinase
MTRAVIYKRVSTQRQAQEDRYSLAEQDDKCDQYCASKGYDVVANLEDVYSGAELAKRPKMSELRDLIRKQKIDVVVATTLDRIGRSQTHQTVVLYEAEEHGVRLELTEEVCEDTDTGRLMRMFSGFFAEIEREKIQGRTLRGKQQRAREGKMLPSNIPLYGYSWADEHKTRYVENPVTAPIARRIWNEATSGKPTRRIAIDLTREGIDCPKDAWRREKGDPSDPPQGNGWVYNTVRGILHNPAYWGNHTAFRWDKMVKRRDVDPITGDVTRVQEVREREVGDGRDAIEALTRRLNELDAEEGNLARMARKIADGAGSDRLIAELELVAKEKQGVHTELEQLEQDERDQETARERLQAVKVMIAGIAQAGEQFTYAKKRVFLWMLNVRVTVRRVGHDLRIDVTAGRYGEMKLLRLAPDDAMYCDQTIHTVQ